MLDLIFKILVWTILIVPILIMIIIGAIQFLWVLAPLVFVIVLIAMFKTKSYKAV